MERLKNIIRNEKVGKCFYNLYDRWRDESDYEDINEYGKAIVNVIKQEFPDYEITLISSTKRPFGVKFKLYHAKVHLFVRIEKGNLILHCKWF